MTTAVIGIALALPSGLYLLLENVLQVGHEWGGTTQISLFLKPEIEDHQARALADQLYQRTDIHSVRVITRAEALEEYRTLSGFGEALEVLEQNPLPAVLVVQPSSHEMDTQMSEVLLNSLKAFPEVEVAQFDMLWLQRLMAMMEIIKRGVLIVSSLLALTVLLVIGNTIRLAIYNRREEIEVTQLFGATETFIRRPFLYTGFWYGFVGSLIAWFIIKSSFWLLQSPIKQLAVLYYSQFEPITLNFYSSLVLLLSGILLGLAGAWIAVNRHLKEIQPR
jgi:cell division transport system permease protein